MLDDRSTVFWNSHSQILQSDWWSLWNSCCLCGTCHLYLLRVDKIKLLLYNRSIPGESIRLVTEPLLKSVEVLKPLGVRLAHSPFWGISLVVKRMLCKHQSPVRLWYSPFANSEYCSCGGIGRRAGFRFQ